jgi:hypothetical protein
MQGIGHKHCAPRRNCIVGCLAALVKWYVPGHTFLNIWVAAQKVRERRTGFAVPRYFVVLLPIATEALAPNNTIQHLGMLCRIWVRRLAQIEVWPNHHFREHALVASEACVDHSQVCAEVDTHIVHPAFWKVRGYMCAQRAT